MTNIERFDRFFCFSKELDRTPVFEWATWWDKTLDNWFGEGLPRALDRTNGIHDYFGQDRVMQFWLPVRNSMDFPQPAYHGAPIIETARDYQKLKPMLSRALYNTFVLPYYQQLSPLIKAHGTKVFIDTDGMVEPLIPWFKDGGIEGVLPLERMAGVDVNRIRVRYPDFFLIGGYDKTVMCKGEEAMRTEFERIKPTIQAGGYIPSVDHQTPPDVSLEAYRTYMKLYFEYAQLRAD